MRENGGKFSFSRNWCHRFRSDITLRPLNCARYQKSLSLKSTTMLISRVRLLQGITYLKLSWLVVINQLGLVPRAKRTRSKRGSIRIRVIGVGQEKPQITLSHCRWQRLARYYCANWFSEGKQKGLYLIRANSCRQKDQFSRRLIGKLLRHTRSLLRKLLCHIVWDPYRRWAFRRIRSCF